MEYDKLIEAIKTNDKDGIISQLTSISMIEDDELMLKAAIDVIFAYDGINLEQKKAFITTAASVGISIWCVLSSSYIIEKNDDPNIINHILDAYINSERSILSENDKLVAFMIESALLNRIRVLQWIKSAVKAGLVISKNNAVFIDDIIAIPECKEASVIVKSIVAGI